MDSFKEYSKPLAHDNKSISFTGEKKRKGSNNEAAAIYIAWVG